MSREQAEAAGVPHEERRSYFRVDNGKANMTPPMEKAEWRKFVSEPLDNGTQEDPGDWVGVVTKWELPDPFDGAGSGDLAKVQAKIETGAWAKDPRQKTGLDLRSRRRSGSMPASKKTAL